MAPKKKGKTRNSSLDKRTELLGQGKEMIEDDLPTLRSCLQYGMYLKEKASQKGEEIEVHSMAKEVYSKVASLYNKANAKLTSPVIMNETVFAQKLTRAWNDVNAILWKKKGWSTIKTKLEGQLDKLFDLIYCKCSILCVEVVACSMARCAHRSILCCDKDVHCVMDNCPHKKTRSCVQEVSCAQPDCRHLKTMTCMCPKHLKIPTLDLSFIRAQRLKVGEKSAFKMGPVDKRETERQLGTLKRKEGEKMSDDKRDEKAKQADEEENLRNQEVEQFMTEIPDEAATDNDNDREFRVKKVDDSLKQSLQNRISFPTVAATSMRYGASNRLTAAIATAALVDAGLVTEEDSILVIDHHKVKREKQKLMNKLRLQADKKYKEEDIYCILFDGRKNWTNMMQRDPETGKYYQYKEKQEHIVVTSEPGGEYLFHFVPEEATQFAKASKQVATKIVDWIKGYEVDITLDAIGGDSTNANTGKDGGSFTHIEQMLERKLTWLVCFLHLNELPLRHLISDLDGKTTSDHTFSGPLGKALGNYFHNVQPISKAFIYR